VYASESGLDNVGWNGIREHLKEKKKKHALIAETRLEETRTLSLQK
jgi:hypothetical protein